MALGADRRQIVALVLRGAFGLIAVGLLIGLPLTLGTGRFLGNQLYGMSPYNPVVTLSSYRGARIIGTHRVIDSSAPGQSHLAHGSFTHGVGNQFAQPIYRP